MAEKKAVFLDRDGTLVKDPGYLDNPDGIRFLSGVVPPLRLLRQNGFLLILITNQSGIGRGFFSEETLLRIHRKLQSMLNAKHIFLDGIYYCPHAPAAQCGCRKPAGFLFKKAAEELGIDPFRSYAIGDKPEDAAAARQIGCRTVLLGGGTQATPQDADFQARNFSAAVRWILAQDKGIGPDSPERKPRIKKQKN